MEQLKDQNRDELMRKARKIFKDNYNLLLEDFKCKYGTDAFLIQQIMVEQQQKEVYFT